MTFKYTEIACYKETADGVPRVQHERETESLEAAVAALDGVKAADSDIKYLLIIQQGQIYPCWDTRVGAVTQPGQ
jgi:hypothetical protein